MTLTQFAILLRADQPGQQLLWDDQRKAFVWRGDRTNHVRWSTVQALESAGYLQSDDLTDHNSVCRLTEDGRAVVRTVRRTGRAL